MPLIEYKRPDALQYGGDVSLGVEHCPIPTVCTDVPHPWRITDFGLYLPNFEIETKYGTESTWIHVIYEKRCGHAVKERISFSEGVHSFNHYGTIFRGEDYSQLAWRERIQFFQNCLLCDVCQASWHRWWIVANGMWDQPHTRPVPDLERHLDCSYENWREFLSIEQDFPGGKVGNSWRPKNRPRPNTYRSHHEDHHISRSSCESV